MKPKTSQINKVYFRKDVRQRLEETFFQDSFEDLDRATSILQRHFPYHIVEKKGDFLQVLTKDRSVAIASFGTQAEKHQVS